MKRIQQIGLGLFISALVLFAIVPFTGDYTLTEATIEKLRSKIQTDHQPYITELNTLIGQSFKGKFEFLNELNAKRDIANETIVAAGNYGITPSEYWDTTYKFWILKYSVDGFFVENKSLLSFWVFVIGTLAALLYIVPLFWDGPPGIKNNGIFHSSATSRGWIGYVAGVYFITFYVVLYLYPYLFTESVSLADPVSALFGNGEASQWFVYGLIYSLAVTVMGVRMFAKYRHNKYHLIRTVSIIFFQLGFAFILPEILAALNQPAPDLKNIWPLDYDFFFDYNLNTLTSSGAIGLIFLAIGLINMFLAVPVFTYVFGKRWYCSWVCGCGGLAETLGDPYRQLSDKSLKAWKLERISIHAVLVFAVVMTGFVLYHYFTGNDRIIGISAYDVRHYYGLGISSWFAGIVGTGFYPILGNRVWCRFGCPLAAIFGIIQKYKSRFRITTNADQCISCGNCSTYCEQGIDVKWYAQRGQNIVRASCVGCGVCAAVCPRGVLRLENGVDDANRKDIQAINIINDEIKIH